LAWVSIPVIVRARRGLPISTQDSTMNVWLKRVLFGLVIALIIAVVGLAIFLLTFNPNAYKSKLEDLVYAR
jgi:hypothetical protein